MSGHLLDTSVIAELTNASPNPGVVDFLSDHDDLWLSSVVLHELELRLQLLPQGQGRDDLRLALGELTSEFGDRILPLGRREAEWAARLGAQARLAGHVPRAEVALLAGIAKAHDLVIAIRDAQDFDGLDVAVTNPWEHAPALPETQPGQAGRPGESPSLGLRARWARRAGARAGVDGVRDGWVMPSPVQPWSRWSSRCGTHIDDSGRRRGSAAASGAIDMPTGLPGAEARRPTRGVPAIGGGRSSLFWTPPLCVLDATATPKPTAVLDDRSGSHPGLQPDSQDPRTA